jgi:hypothetical protein
MLIVVGKSATLTLTKVCKAIQYNLPTILSRLQRVSQPYHKNGEISFEFFRGRNPCSFVSTVDRVFIIIMLDNFLRKYDGRMMTAAVQRKNKRQG